MLKQMRPEFAVTLAANRDHRLRPSNGSHRFSPDLVIARLRREAREFHDRWDRLILGRDWSRAPMDRRTDGIWVPEHIHSNAHLHGAFRLPAACRGTLTADEFQSLAQDVYRKMAPSGTLVAKPMDIGWFTYMAKDVRHPDGIWLRHDAGIS
jgi:hypothetical protein